MQLINDLLDVSRMVTGKMRLDVRPLDLRAVVEAALDSVGPAANAKGVQLQRVFDPNAAAVAGDPARLQQVLWNLVTNAVKFTPRGGHVRVRLARANSHVEITVSDTGQGIRRDLLPHIFERFWRADRTSTRPHTGLGLGLALVRHLVEAHGGEVRADSAGEGRGTTFTVTLPVAIVQYDPRREVCADPRVVNRPPTGLGPSLQKLRVLIVDDDRDGLDLVGAILANAGAETRLSMSATDALAVVKAWRPDVLVSDIEMPGEDGYSLIRKVRALDRAEGGRTPAIALTAYGRTEDRLRAISAGYNIHVPKPVDPAGLTTILARIADR